MVRAASERSESLATLERQAHVQAGVEYAVQM
jgi:hypothetical protein